MTLIAGVIIIMGFIGKAFYAYGLWAAKKPFTAIFIGILVVVIGAVGFLNEQTTADPQALWVPPASRANVEQQYFDKEFGAFFRINTGWMSPLNEAQANEDIFQRPYLELLYWLQYSIVSDIATVNEMDFTLNDFCYKPISGEGCLVESPM